MKSRPQVIRPVVGSRVRQLSTSLNTTRETCRFQHDGFHDRQHLYSHCKFKFDNIYGHIDYSTGFDSDGKQNISHMDAIGYTIVHKI